MTLYPIFLFNHFYFLPFLFDELNILPIFIEEI
jgi:hypothetical protein